MRRSETGCGQDLVHMAKYAPGTGRIVRKIDMVLAILKFAIQSKECLCTLMEILRRNLGVLMF